MSCVAARVGDARRCLPDARTSRQARPQIQRNAKPSCKGVWSSCRRKHRLQYNQSAFQRRAVYCALMTHQARLVERTDLIQQDQPGFTLEGYR